MGKQEKVHISTYGMWFGYYYILYDGKRKGPQLSVRNKNFLTTIEYKHFFNGIEAHIFGGKFNVEIEREEATKPTNPS